MAKLIVSTWGCSHMLRAATITERLRSLEQALATCDAKIAASGKAADGLVKGIFVAPEYLISRQFAGWDAEGGGSIGFTVERLEHDRVVRELINLSRRYRRILFLPGTVAWERPLKQKAVERHIKYYAQRIPNYNLLPENELLSAIKATFRVDVASGLVVNHYQMQEFLGTHGYPMVTRPLDDRWITNQRKSNPRFYLYLVSLALAPRGGYLGLANAAENTRNRVGKGARYMMLNTAYALLNGQIVGTYHKQGNFNEEQGDTDLAFLPGAAKGIFDFEGFRCGLEVCVDHDIGMLRKQLRGDLLDLQIVLSAWVQFSPANLMVREGGYFVHASTEPSVNGVWQRTASGLQEIATIGSDPAAGYPVKHFMIKLQNRHTFSLADTFMGDLPGRDPGVPQAKRWAPVQTPAKPFRSR